MCRSTDYHGFQPRRDRLKIRAFFLRFSGLNTGAPLPESLTLSFLPRINEKRARDRRVKDPTRYASIPHSLPGRECQGEGWGSAIRIPRAGRGRRWDPVRGKMRVKSGNWSVSARWRGERVSVATEIAEAQVCVAVEGHVAMIERVRMVVKKTKKHRNCGFKRLEEIPEEGEVDYESDGCCCKCGSDGEDSEVGGDVDGEDEELEVDMEGVRWAVDVGIWVMCLGVGYFVSKASAKTLRRRRLF
ncbi:uncharacterized protein Pyn_35806 [Prunus yedoensis var. nudiflora]|uniref:Uncharacterized protein n=1 Tax=Prunus yedoensis var. nudiflora TaxID=2094558 RepID=A0A314UW90_PRUYE|nr:uncharacterized protein Pyn_35806 [Prunus yedoensis var. nudiflora]